MSVLIVHPVLIAGGAEAQVVCIARHLERRGVDFSIATLSTDYEGLPPETRGFPVLRPANQIPYRVRSYALNSTLGVFKEARILRRLVRREGKRFTVLNPHNFPAMWACSLEDRPCLWQCNEPPDLWSNPAAAPPVQLLTRAGKPVDVLLVRRYATEIAANAEWTQEKVRERYGREAVVVHPGVDYDFFSHGVAGRLPHPWASKEAFLLLEVGTFAPQKNQLGAVRAVEALVASGMDDVRLLLVGSSAGPYGDEVKAFVRSRKLEPYVEIVGRRDEEFVRDAYALADAVVFPTLAQSLGLAPLEAICADTPCVVSPDAGMSRVIRAVGGGVVSTNLVAGVRYLREHYAEVTQGLPRAKAYIQAEFDWETYGRRMSELLEGLER